MADQAHFFVSPLIMSRIFDARSLPSSGYPLTLHEVRSLSARLYTEKYGKEFANALLGHKSVKITYSTALSSTRRKISATSIGSVWRPFLRILPKAPFIFSQIVTKQSTGGTPSFSFDNNLAEGPGIGSSAFDTGVGDFTARDELFDDDRLMEANG
ncbi:MAG: hypothetical protein QM756_23690 [Polyangiaceae bacterium]